eukprot:TRINITY_DN100602_c0_g1_i1.p1 TRINITY_DN100602_c0_g1~~TRINITY_DN100602_c0_g1_i1.p1  ORF type:complete len:559 (-),score=109.57 TRINITY_DN100602_c0_g1_i1:85-1761(-)
MAPGLHPVHDMGSHKLSAMSSNRPMPAWTFGAGPRFGKSQKDPKIEMRLRNSSASPKHGSWSPAHNISTQTLTTTATLHGGEPTATEMDDDGFMGGEEPSRGSRIRSDWTGGWSIGDFVPRLDGGLDRMADLPERKDQPKPKMYDPAPTIGEATAVIIPHAPKWSFGGGKSRMDFDKKPALKMKKSASDSQAVKELKKFRAQVKATTPSRGFGSEIRCRVKGGPMELPWTPGPAAYETERSFDMKPQWSPSTLVPWGTRTGSRPVLRFPTATDAGPGEYTAHHPMAQTSPAPIFAHPLRERMVATLPGPGQYPIPTRVGDAPKWKMGSGKRQEMVKDNGNPGPGTYRPDLTSIDPDSFCAFFGESKRGHECDDIDPDEPPGPGSHDVVPAWSPATTRTPGFPKEEKLKKTPGLGPQGLPGPGLYKLSPSIDTSEGKGMSIGVLRPVKQEVTLGPGQYSPEYKQVNQSGPEWKSLGRTAPRRAPWETVGNSQEDKQMDKVNKMLRESGTEPKLPGESLLKFKPQGPKWSIQRRTPIPGGSGIPPKSENHHAMTGAFSTC